ncbi:hypothetical protein DFH07DRAFT_782714 [Mycena maculata]|uniref:Uncharacterized protein n=1 Tax=Mycena maculata TaxID=230809 RepID=A0AAD7HR68_9AGAR|nr:hypothetical protein DFH07DRAFT_782714 [Mycena maculata]
MSVQGRGPEDMEADVAVLVILGVWIRWAEDEARPEIPAVPTADVEGIEAAEVEVDGKVEPKSEPERNGLSEVMGACVDGSKEKDEVAGARRGEGISSSSETVSTSIGSGNSGNLILGLILIPWFLLDLQIDEFLTGNAPLQPTAPMPGPLSVTWLWGKGWTTDEEKEIEDGIAELMALQIGGPVRAKTDGTVPEAIETTWSMDDVLSGQKVHFTGFAEDECVICGVKKGIGAGRCNCFVILHTSGDHVAPETRG